MGVWSRHKPALRENVAVVVEVHQELARLRAELLPSNEYRVRQVAAHSLATLLSRKDAAHQFALELSEGDALIPRLMVLASEAEQTRDTLSLQLCLSCIANYSYIDPASVAASEAMKLLMGALASSDGTSALCDPRLHTYAVVIAYNLRDSHEVMRTLQASACEARLRDIVDRGTSGAPLEQLNEVDAKRAAEVLQRMQRVGEVRVGQEKSRGDTLSVADATQKRVAWRLPAWAAGG